MIKFSPIYQEITSDQSCIIDSSFSSFTDLDIAVDFEDFFITFLYYSENTLQV